MTKALFEKDESSSEDLDYGDRSSTGSESSGPDQKVATLAQMTYQRVNAGCQTAADGVVFTNPQSRESMRVFINFGAPAFLAIAAVPNPLSSQMQAVTKGWKFHVRVAATDPETPGQPSNLERSWPIMLEVFNKYRVGLAKIIREDRRQQLANDPQQCFKTYTIYAFKDQRPAAEWLPILIEIERRLTQAGIQPATIPITETSRLDANREFVIPNSRFCSYRNDGSTKLANPYQNFRFPAPTTNLNNDDDGYDSAPDNDDDDGPPTLGS